VRKIVVSKVGTPAEQIQRKKKSRKKERDDRR